MKEDVGVMDETGAMSDSKPEDCELGPADPCFVLSSRAVELLITEQDPTHHVGEDEVALQNAPPKEPRAAEDEEIG